MKASTSVTVISTGSLSITVKKTFRSKAVAITVLGRARAVTSSKYASSNGCPRRISSPLPDDQREDHLHIVTTHRVWARPLPYVGPRAATHMRVAENLRRFTHHTASTVMLQDS